MRVVSGYGRSVPLHARVEAREYGCCKLGMTQDTLAIMIMGAAACGTAEDYTVVNVYFAMAMAEATDRS
jgi:hypothetical protein